MNSLGKVCVAAVTAAGKMQNMVVAPMETLGITMATYAGQNLGAGKIPRITQGMHRAFAVGLIYSAAAAAAIWVFSGPLCLLFVDAEETEVISQAVYFIGINAFFYPVLSILFITRNMLQGVGFSFLPMLAGASELAARAVVSIGLVPVFGFDAACFASPVAWSAATVLLLVVYNVKMHGMKKRFEEGQKEAAAESI